MRSFILFSIAITLSLVFHNCGQVGNSLDSSDVNISLDSLVVAPFFQSYPELKKYEKELVEIYRDYNYNFIWFDNKGIVEYANSLYSKVIDIEDEGISSTFPYQTNIVYSLGR